MTKVAGFLEIERHHREYEPGESRIRHWHEFVLPLPEKESAFNPHSPDDALSFSPTAAIQI